MKTVILPKKETPVLLHFKRAERQSDQIPAGTVTPVQDIIVEFIPPLSCSFYSAKGSRIGSALNTSSQHVPLAFLPSETLARPSKR